MAFITIDLGTTNIKVALFSDALQELDSSSQKVHYHSQGALIEFDAEQYFADIVSSIAQLVPQLKEPVHQLVLTGQAESLVVLDASGRPLRRAISWLDMRSTEECAEIRRAFPEEAAYQVTGQPTNTPTWPITKILWLKKHEPELFARVDRFVLLKDYIAYNLTGVLLGEYSIYNFSYYFDVRAKDYWQAMLDFCGIRRDQLPELVEPCTTIGTLRRDIAGRLGLDAGTAVNCGTLDHFAGMIGTGNIRPGLISESTGTVLSLATLVEKPLLDSGRIPCHYGPFPDSYVLLPVCESGGVSLEWFRDKMAADLSYRGIDEQVSSRVRPGDVVFLPYLTGTNSPDYDQAAKGVFYGLRLNHDKIDCALAVMEGVAYLLERNLRSLRASGIEAGQVITTGGGSRSAIWCQIKADMTGCPIVVPAQTEAASLGCALIGAVASGVQPDYATAVAQAVTLQETYHPAPGSGYTGQVQRYDTLYRQLQPLFQLDESLQRTSGSPPDAKDTQS